MTEIHSSAASIQTRAHRLGQLWPRQQPVVMGILNCTPDSFSDGGRFADLDAAIAGGQVLIAEGADIVDIGGESTRPGAPAVSVDEENRRVIPVIAELRRRFPEILISVDTSKLEVAGCALAAGADLVNDVTGASAPGMLSLVAAERAGIVLMHMRGTPRSMQLDTEYGHVAAEVHRFLRQRARAAVAAGIPASAVWLDPGIGFGKDDEGNLQLLAALPELAALGHPVLVGPSRKAFIGRLTGAATEARLPGTLAALVPTVGLARAVVRVHDPGPAVQFLRVLAGIREAA